MSAFPPCGHNHRCQPSTWGRANPEVKLTGRISRHVRRCVTPARVSVSTCRVPRQILVAHDQHAVRGASRSGAISTIFLTSDMRGQFFSTQSNLPSYLKRIFCLLKKRIFNCVLKLIRLIYSEVKKIAIPCKYPESVRCSAISKL